MAEMFSLGVVSLWVIGMLYWIQSRIRTDWSNKKK